MRSACVLYAASVHLTALASYMAKPIYGQACGSAISHKSSHLEGPEKVVRQTICPDCRDESVFTA